jgi:OOP family OmpA-OmpF porin
MRAISGVILSIFVLVLSGCATTSGSTNQYLCAAAGALVAGGGVALADGDEEVAVVGAAVGAALGYLACNEGEAPPPPKPEPIPVPAQKPAMDHNKDSDGDGVLDMLDECPNTPLGTPVDKRGCPEIPNLTGVNFDFDKHSLTSEGKSILDAAVRILDNNPHVRVEIVGYTDSKGSDDYNQALSERRANSVSDYLETNGINSNRLLATGRGESQPVADNDTREGRAMNRRVELTAHPM